MQSATLSTADLLADERAARWDEIDLGDGGPVIELTKELIGAHLA